MNWWKKLGKTLLFPHIAIMIVLLPVATVLLIYELGFTEIDTMRTYVAYALSAYVLVIWCARIPVLVRMINTFKNSNKYAVRWREDVRLRMNVSLYGTFIWNIAYAALQFGLGCYHASSWYYSMAGYYILLAALRFSLGGYTRKYSAGEQMQTELKKYRFCGWVFLVINTAISAMMFLMISQGRNYGHHAITVIAMAAYTFTTFTFAIINIIKFRKYKSPVYSASKAISLSAACVSMLTLEDTMLITFSDGAVEPLMRKMFLVLSGGAVSVFIIAMAIYMIVRANKLLTRNAE